MKRQPIVQDMYRVFPLFAWHKCESCKQEFRRERGWRYFTGPFYGGHGIWRYLCGSCAPTLADAKKLAKSLSYGEVPGNRPPPTPTIPQPRKETR